jgi:L-ascorbate metabolism protein UlaG (beta-lactamase superfamily)
VTTTIDWYGCATFRLRTGGLTVFLDAYIDRATNAPGSGLTADDIDACDWIVVGHSHFDHLFGAERIAANTGARIIGSYETVRVMEQAGVPVEQMICVAGGETIALSDDVRVTVLPSQHSCVWSHKQMVQADEVCLGDLGVTWQEQRTRFGELLQHFSTNLPAESLEAHARVTAG